MSREEILELRRRVQEADLSVNNSNMQQIFENELKRWVESYEYKKNHKMIDCYGEPREIPDKIKIDRETYNPKEILEHIKARDEIGMGILEKLVKYRDAGRYSAEYIKHTLINDVLKEEVNLDEVILMGMNNLTRRNLINEVINVDSESIFLTTGTPAAIMRLYGRVDDLVYDKVNGKFTKLLHFIFNALYIKE